MRLINTCIALSLAMSANAVIAQEVSVDEARSRALDFLSGQSVGPKQAKGQDLSNDISLAYTSRSGQKTCFYVFNAGHDNGFVIIGGDQSAREILGYCDHGTFDYDTAPENFKWWLSQYAQQITHADASAVAVSRAPRRARASSSREQINSLVSCKWNQGTPYNNSVPTFHDSVFVTGCVATAMAQVMYKYQSPASSTTDIPGYDATCYYSKNNARTTFSDKMTISTIAAADRTYDWDNMIVKYVHGETSDNYNATQAAAVAKLMYHVGVSVNMNYGTQLSGGSGANSDKIGPALANYFGYDKSVRNEYRTYYTDDAWEDLVYAELAAGRPVLYAGDVASGGGHQFVCDGYDSDNQMFTFNWGWGSYCDGSYPLTGTGALQPNGSGIGGHGGGSAYTYNQQILVNVMPDADNAESPHLVQASNDNMYLYVGESQYEGNYGYTAGTSTTASLYFAPKNVSCLTTSFDCGVKATEQTTGITYYWTSTSNQSYSIGYSSSTTPLDFNLSQIVYNGTYDIRPVCRKAGQTDADWVEVDLLTTETMPTITVTDGTEPSHISINFTVSNNTVQVARTLQIECDSQYHGTVTYSSEDTSVATVDDNGVITGVAEGTVKITAVGQASGFFDATTKVFTITVEPLVKEDVVFSISETQIMVGSTAQISWNEDYTGSVTFTASPDGIVSVDADGLVTAGTIKGTATITCTPSGDTYYTDQSATISVTVLNETIILTECPYFNNGNNPYEDDLVFTYSLKNTSGATSDAVIHYTISVDHGMSFQGGFGYTNVPDQSIVPGTYDFKTIGEYDLRKYLSEGNTYTVYLYTDQEHTHAFNFPSVTFTYRKKLEVPYVVSPAGWGTLILPFDYAKPNDMTLYKCDRIENGILNLTAVSGNIERNIPYIVMGTYGTDYSFTGPEAVDASTPSFNEQNSILVGAVADGVALVSGDYILQYHEDEGTAFYRFDGSFSMNVTPYRAFLRLPSSTTSDSFAISASGADTEGIDAISTEAFRPAGIYTIDGKRLSDFQKGLNILILENGTTQKVFVK